MSIKKVLGNLNDIDGKHKRRFWKYNFYPTDYKKRFY